MVESVKKQEKTENDISLDSLNIKMSFGLPFGALEGMTE
jgi:hypothetical protein